AERLGIGTVVVPADAGLLSALGLGGAVAERVAERQILEGLEEASGRLERWLEELEAEARRALEADGVAAGEVVVRRRIASLRLAGQDATLQVECGRGSSLAEAFAARYRAVYGHGPPRRPVELESLRVVASSRPLEAREAPRPARSREARPGRTRRARLGGAWRDARVFAAEVLEPGDRLRGPALVLEDHTTTVVDAGWRAEVDGAGALVLRREEPHGLAASPRRAPGAVELELFASRFRAIAVEMGEMLRRTALSVNVKERLDFSCALLDPAGRLVVNAPHIPVHLGALGLCVRSLRAALHLGPGDVAVTNHPALGGSHLPDVTVVRPIHLPGGELLGHVASRAHHAEIGGSAPGSMPPRARSLAEEGVVIPPTYLVRGGDARWEDLRRLLESGPYPSRAVEENLADLRAALAAGERGAQALLALASDHGSGTVLRFMAELERAAAARMRAVLRRLPPGRREAEERLDDGTSLRAAVDVSGGEARIDFTGTSGVHPGSLNATPGIVRSVVLYFLRLLAAAHPAEEAAAGGGEWLPLNEGLLEPVEIVVPPGLLDPPFAPDPAACPALAGGNVETSQRLVGVLLKAVGLMASSQGTMNNVVFGNERLGYYETVCGGAGAGPGFHGASAVHTHMTNTRITDPEVLEHRYPVRVERFALRRGSGGAGRWRGGDGVVREIAFLEPMTLSVLGQHRTAGPYGLEGGEPGMPAVQRLVRASGEVLELASSDGCEVRPGDRFVLETPGGGGYGSP
ncbi:MAG: hydantoinase B/oxoprolinase family protein, partial [Planctomycetes bacterium]|nr:hydantoinase B/oxoprolinase family protein [Planctomycetota bacterium]